MADFVADSDDDFFWSMIWTKNKQLWSTLPTSLHK